MEIYRNLKVAKEMGLDPMFAINSRRRYLTVQLWGIEQEIQTRINTRWQNLGDFAAFLSITFELDQGKEAIKTELKVIDKMINQQNDFAITDEMIVQARAYPIDKLVHFIKGSALAFCHADKTPSLTWDKKRNRARCWPCNKSFDPIGILMERDGLKFKDAVRELAGR